MGNLPHSPSANNRVKGSGLIRTPPAGMIVRQSEPKNLEFPFHQLDSFLTRTELFYVRSHFPVPALDKARYRLRVDGAVRNPVAFTYDELRSLPSQTYAATLECAGNGRSFLTPPVEGVQWDLGAVGTAEWTGVPLKLLLAEADLTDDASEIVFEGADRGSPKEKPAPPHPIAFARSLPCKHALAPEVLIAYQMNGHDLPPDHGYPARLIVPGQYGMAWVKWLTRIHAIRETFEGYWQTTDYAFWDELDGEPVRRPLSAIKLKSQISRPSMYEVVPPGQPYTIFGAAWSGSGVPVAAVDVSTDGGKTWNAAELLDPPHAFAWRRWQMTWHAPETCGRYQLVARARDAHGLCQPDQHDDAYGPYVIDHQLAIEVLVGSGDRS